MDAIDVLNRIGSLSRGALRHEVMKRLLIAIFRGELPPGTRLIVLRLAEQFQISSTPVREALVELAAVGMVDFVHNRGVLVKPFGPRQLQDIYQLRRILETEATRCACGRIDRESLETLRQKMTDLAGSNRRRDWSQRVMAVDQQLHELIAVGCGNDRLADEIKRYNTLVQTVREIVGIDLKVEERALTEHLAILDAMLNGDAEAAASQMARHVDNSEQAAEAVMFSKQFQ